MTTKLRVYNDALIFLGERTLSALTEEREPRRVLDSVWDNGAVNYCLSEGMWNFAARIYKLDYEPSITPQFGYERAIAKPDDFVKLCQISADEFMTHPLNAFWTTPDYWFCNHDSIYVKYVSNDASYGANLTIWPEDFGLYVSSYLAWRTARRIVGGETAEDKAERRMKIHLDKARSSDASEEPTQFNPGGRMVRSRMGGRTQRG